ncbi:MAG: peptidoglycan DD-metalloendopeptidase family protein [Gemmatimonadota bacterium]|jgi:murein DD-endopeptidase MepM/ murein hydrolase activator NlpD
MIPKTRFFSPLALVGFGGLLGIVFVAGRLLASQPPEVGPLDPVVAAPAERLETVSLRPGETLGEVLSDAEIGWSDQNSLLMAFREQASPRSLQEESRITLRWYRDQDLLRGVDVALNKDQTVRLSRDAAGWASGMIHTPIWVDTLFISGEVENLLWFAVLENPLLSAVPEDDRIEVVTWMDRVFQWQIDFSRQVRAGDTYRLVYEREVRPDGSMRSGHILAAEYVNQGMPYRAIWFDPNDDGDGTFYDEDGKSVRRAFLTKPLELGRISSVYSDSRLHPIHNIRRPHRGVDYAAATGTPIMATGDGVVIFADWRGELGRLVEIQHPNGWVTRYGHMSAFGQGIRPGTRVRQGQIIGRVGATGGATGPHVHYEMRMRDGSPLNPLRLVLPPGDPVPTSAWARWALESIERLTLLSTLDGPPIPLLRMAEQSPELQSPDSVSEQRGTPGGD